MRTRTASRGVRPGMRRRSVMCCVLSAIAGCGAEVGQSTPTGRTVATTAGSPTPQPESSPIGDDDRAWTSPVITVPPSEAIEEAVIAGPITLSSGCLYIDAGEGGLGVVVFSHGTRWEPMSSAVVNPDGTSVAVGETLEASGGGHRFDEPSGSLLPGDDAREVRRCADSAGVGLYYVVGRVAAREP
jgi:hypothetical protein